LRGRIEKVLDAAKAKGFRQGEKSYEHVAAFVGRLRESDSLTVLTLEFCILTAARSGEVLGGGRGGPRSISAKGLDASPGSDEGRT
jgi:hypothetical protein